MEWSKSGVILKSYLKHFAQILENLKEVFFPRHNQRFFSPTCDLGNFIIDEIPSHGPVHHGRKTCTYLKLMPYKVTPRGNPMEHPIVMLTDFKKKLVFNELSARRFETNT